MVNLHSFFKMTRVQCSQAGWVLLLIVLGVAIYSNEMILVSVALIMGLINLTIPMIFYPFAVIWWGLARFLKFVSSRVLMSLVFFLVVTPMGLARRLLGYDDLKMKQFKKESTSVMTDRYHEYLPEDLKNIF